MTYRPASVLSVIPTAPQGIYSRERGETSAEVQSFIKVVIFFLESNRWNLKVKRGGWDSLQEKEGQRGNKEFHQVYCVGSGAFIYLIVQKQQLPCTDG